MDESNPAPIQWARPLAVLFVFDTRRKRNVNLCMYIIHAEYVNPAT
jgi:hypothetical protein